MGELTSLLAAVRAGTPGAIDRVVELTYRELHALAHQRLRRAGPITTLDTTALVHECYLKLQRLGELQTEDRAHFMSYAGRAMRSIIVDLARQRRAARRGGEDLKVTLPSEVFAEAATGAEQLLAIDQAIESLRRLDERLVRVVELKYFAGLTNEEVAAALDVDERTVRRDWDKARMVLYEQLRG